MKIYANQLSKHLKELSPVYLISGDEFLLVQEAADAIRHHAKKQDFDEREIIHVNRSVSWEDFYKSADNLSLFSSKKIIELRFDQKPNKAAQEAIGHYLSQGHSQDLLLIITPKLEKASEKTKWYKAIESVGICVAVWPIDQSRLPEWVKARAAKHKLTLSNDAINAICAQTEGNLLATNQEIEKLSLLFLNNNPSTNDVIDTLSNSYHHNVFNLVDCCLQRDPAQIGKVLASLKSEGVEATLILWALTRELRTVLRLIDGVKQSSLDKAFMQQRIWDKRKPIYRQYLQRCQQKRLLTCLQRSAQIDRCIKGAATGNVWRQLLQLSLMFGHAC